MDGPSGIRSRLDPKGGFLSFLQSPHCHLPDVNLESITSRARDIQPLCDFRTVWMHNDYEALPISGYGCVWASQTLGWFRFLLRIREDHVAFSACERLSNHYSSPPIHSKEPSPSILQLSPILLDRGSLWFIDLETILDLTKDISPRCFPVCDPSIRLTPRFT